MAEFAALFAASLRGLEREEAGILRLELDGAAEVEARARDLAARESTCCSFFALSFSRTDQDLLQMRVRVPQQHRAVLDGLQRQAADAAGLA
ncbi:hypothetical protein [Nonomuraea sp. B19D2]|uniref:hypothetical protein n=1 Tax=Nonomuraea sp. B19D2 TaxID=3159561 RepID=UPI0032DA5B20